MAVCCGAIARGGARHIPWASPRLMWTAPIASCTFLIYEQVVRMHPHTQHVRSNSGRPPPKQVRSVVDGTSTIPREALAAAAPIVLTLAVAIRTPFDIVEQRRQLMARADGRSVVGMMRTIAHRDGVPALFRGYLPCLAATGAFVGCYFVVYEATRRLYSLASDGGRDVGRKGGARHLAAGALASACTAAVVTPLDVLKTRTQTTWAARPTMKVWRQMVKERALWSGLRPRVMSYAPAGARKNKKKDR